MDTAILVAIITGMIGIIAALITERFNRQRARQQEAQWAYEKETDKLKWEHERETERRKWEYQREFEAHKQGYEEELWLLNLYAQRELNLHQKRIELYPQVFKALEVLSRHKINTLSTDDARALADQINVWAYNEVGLVMCNDTRDEMIKLRDALFRLARGEMTDRSELTSRDKAGPRTRLIEMMRRDVSQSDSAWLADMNNLIETNRDTVRNNTPARGTPIFGQHPPRSS